MFEESIELGEARCYDVRVLVQSEHPILFLAVNKQGEVRNVDVFGPGRHDRGYRITDATSVAFEGMADLDYTETRLAVQRQEVAVQEAVDPESATVDASDYNPSKLSLGAQVQLEMAKYGLGPYAETDEVDEEDGDPFEDQDEFDNLGNGYMEPDQPPTPPIEDKEEQSDDAPAGANPVEEPEKPAEPAEASTTTQS